MWGDQLDQGAGIVGSICQGNHGFLGQWQCITYIRDILFHSLTLSRGCKCKIQS